MTMVNQWSRQGVVLEAGDAFIWRGDLSYLLSPGGGGRWCTLASVDTLAFCPSELTVTADLNGVLEWWI